MCADILIWLVFYHVAMTDRYCVFKDSFLLWQNQLVHRFGLGPGYSLLSCRLESANSFIAHWSFPGLSTSIRFHLVREGHITCWTHQYIGSIVPLRKQMHIPVVQQLLQSLNILYLYIWNDEFKVVFVPKSTKICLCLCRHATYRFNLNVCYSKQQVSQLLCSSHSSCELTVQWPSSHYGIWVR